MYKRSHRLESSFLMLKYGLMQLYLGLDCIINGKRIDKEKDTQGYKMTDGYLKEKLGEIDSSVTMIYDNSSGYIHLSDKAFYETVVACDNNVLEFLVEESCQKEEIRY